MRNYASLKKDDGLRLLVSPSYNHLVRIAWPGIAESIETAQYRLTVVMHKRISSRISGQRM